MIAGTLTRARRRRLNQVLTVCAMLVIAAAVAMVWVRVVQTLTESSGGPKTIGQPRALVWNDRVFTSSEQLKAYLVSKGLSYRRWAARHPTAFGAPAPALAVTKHTTKTTTTSKPVTHPVASAPTVGDARSRPLTSMVLTILLVIAALVLAGSAVVPVRYAPDGIAHFYSNPDRRMVALAASAAILLGFGVSFFLT